MGRFKFLLSLTLLLHISPCAMAEADAYTLKYKTLSTAVPANEPKVTASLLTGLGFTDLSTAYDAFKNHFQMDLMFTNGDLSKAVFVKFNVVPNSELNGAILDDHNGALLAHGRTKGGTPYAVFFLGFSKSEINPILNGLRFGRSANAVPPPFHWFEIILPRAAATEDIAPRCNASKPLSHKADRLLKAIDRGLWTCLKKYVWGAASVPGGAIVGTFDGTLLKNLKYSWSMTKQLYSNFSKVIDDHWEGFWSLEAPDQAKIFCEFTGAAVATGVLTALSGGSGAAVGAIAINSLLEQMEVASKVSAKLKAIRCPTYTAPLPDDGAPSDARPETI